MSDPPICRLCGCTPIRLIDGSVKHDELASQCSLRLSVLTGAEWTALMGVDRDAVRLDWLIRKLSGKALREAGVIYSAGTSTIRSAIDAAMGEQQ